MITLKQNIKNRMPNINFLNKQLLHLAIKFDLLKQPKEEEIINQANVLLKDFLYYRLGQSKILSLKQQFLLMQSQPENNLVLLEILYVTKLFDILYPELYGSVTKQLGDMKLSSAEVTKDSLCAITDAYFQHNTKVTWGDIVAVLNIIGALANDCIRQGHSEYLCELPDSLESCIRNHLLCWLREEGGWVSVELHLSFFMFVSMPDICFHVRFCNYTTGENNV